MMKVRGMVVGIACGSGGAESVNSLALRPTPDTDGRYVQMTFPILDP